MGNGSRNPRSTLCVYKEFNNVKEGIRRLLFYQFSLLTKTFPIEDCLKVSPASKAMHFGHRGAV